MLHFSEFKWQETTSLLTCMRRASLLGDVTRCFPPARKHVRGKWLFNHCKKQYTRCKSLSCWIGFSSCSYSGRGCCNPSWYDVLCWSLFAQFLTLSCGTSTSIEERFIQLPTASICDLSQNAPGKSVQVAVNSHQTSFVEYSNKSRNVKSAARLQKN